MTAKALVYQPRQRWRVGVAFGAAALIHFAAIAIANVHRAETTAGPPYADKFPEITIEPPFISDDPITEPPDPLPTVPKIDEFFPEEKSTPPPVRRHIDKPTAPIVRPTNNGPRGILSWSSARVLAISAPRPEYPYEARRQKLRATVSWR
ncbi:MAG: hypothetical protein QOF24_1981 [Verrucomicrobiota bacterium]